MRCLAKAIRRAYNARSQASLGKGSHSMLQRLVEPAIRFVQIAYERLGFVQRQGVSSVSLGTEAQPYAPRRCAGDNAPVDARGRGDLSPSPLRTVARGSLTIFPQFFLGFVNSAY